MWRPEGWETLKAVNYPLHCLAPDDCVGLAYEAGADAILEALKSSQLPSGTITFPQEGWLVFIPASPDTPAPPCDTPPHIPPGESLEAPTS